MKFLLLVIAFLSFIRQCIAVPDLSELHAPATFMALSDVRVLEIPRDAKDRGVFILAERSLPEKNCNLVRKIWSMITNKTCQSMHYQIYFNGRSIGFFEDRYQDDYLPLSVFLEEYKEHLVVQYYDPKRHRYSDVELNSYLLNYILEHKRDFVTPRSSRKFAADLCEHFFDTPVVSKIKKQLHKFIEVSEAVGCVAGAVCMAGTACAVSAACLAITMLE